MPSTIQLSRHEFCVCQRSMWKSAGTLILFYAMAVASPAQTFSKLADFDATNGAIPEATMVQAVDGNLYGTTNGGGSSDRGVAFKFIPPGTLAVRYVFCNTRNCLSGDYPISALTLSHGGGLYGTTPGGGANSAGTIFKLASGGGFHILYSFCAQPNCADGVNPYPGMVQARDGNFYGTTYNGGTYTYGEIFKISPTGQFAVVYSFCPTVGCADGQAPANPVIQASNGNFYGMTTCGGAHGKGTIFAVTPGGILTTLYSFCSKSNCSDGSYPYAALVQASDGNFYGTTPQGGAYGAGTIFALTPHGFVTLYSLCAQTNCTDGATSYGELIQANDGNLYGTTQLGGTNNLGTVFEITPAGVLTTLHNFAGTDGADPTTGLVQHTDGNLYGTTAVGGLVTTCHPQFGGCGTVFRVSLGLAPFVKTLVSSGKIGSSIVMYGTDLAGATKVTFNGAAATFTVVSATEITAAIPANATTGKIEILTPKGTLSSNAVFHVSP